MRYYNSSTGRFVSEDPIKFFGGDLNLYRYVTNRVGNKIDPSGLREMEGGPIGGGSTSSVEFYFLLKGLYPPDPADVAKDQESARVDARFAKLFPRYLLGYATLGLGPAIGGSSIFARFTVATVSFTSNEFAVVNTLDFIDNFSSSVRGPTTGLPPVSPGGELGSLIGIGVDKVINSCR